MIFLVVTTTAGVYGALAFLLLYPVPNANRELVSMVLGNIMGFLAGIVTYHFGSTQESAEKNATIGTLAQTAKTAQEALTPSDPTPTDEATP
jgi:hypothetical protein